MKLLESYVWTVVKLSALASIKYMYMELTSYEAGNSTRISEKCSSIDFAAYEVGGKRSNGSPDA